MAKTIINLSDPVSTLVTKTNTISSHIGDITQLNTTGADSDIVQAINAINTKANNVDSGVIISLARSNSLDSSEILALIKADSGETSIMSNFQKDSANGIGFDSSQGRFFVPSNTINTAMIEADAITEAKMADDAISSAELKSLSTLLIKDSAGSTLKTIHGAGV
tara:strand:- start:589 stop:1083 length:495 start_codon:yes stop_codon:yes gene_type:complete